MTRDLLLKIIFGGDAAGATKAANDAKSAVDRLGDAIKKPIGKSGAEAALDAIKPKADAATQAVKLSTQQLGNLQFQLQDIAVGLSSGQSPFTVMMQQGSQITQMFSSGTGVLGALKAVGAGITQFLTNPLNLAVVGFGFALTAATSFFSYVISSGADAETVLAKHEDLLKRIKDAYDGNTQSLKAYAQETRNTMLAEAMRDERALAKALRNETGGMFSTGFYAERQMAIGNPYGNLSPERMALGRQLFDAIQLFNRETAQGAPDVKTFADAVSKVAIAADGKSEDLFKLATGILDQIEPARRLQAEHEQSVRLVQSLTNNMQGLNQVLDVTARATGTAAERLHGSGNPGIIFAGAGSPFTGKSFLDLIGASEGTDRRRSYNETLGYGRFTGGNVDLVTMRLAEILDLQKRMLAHPENTYNSSALGRYQITRQTLLDFMPKLGLTGDTVFSPQVQDKIALAIANAAGRSVDNLRGRWEGLKFVGKDTILSSFDGADSQRAGAAQDMQDAHAAATKKANVEKLKQQEIEKRWAEVMRQGTEGLASRNSVLGRSILETARAAKEQQLLNAAHQIFGETIPAAEMAKIKAMAQSYGELAAATKQAAEAQKDQAEQAKSNIAALDETRSMFGGLASDFLRAREEGKSWGDSFGSVLDKLKEKAFSLIDKLIDTALFGQQGTSNGGLLGGFLTSMLGGFMGGGAASRTLYANGAAFAGGVQAFAGGGIFHRPTLFRYGAGKMGVMGEAGPEAVMPLLMGRGGLGVGVATGSGEGHLPLTRLGSGRLGVKAFADGDVFGGSLPRGSGSASRQAITINHTVNNHAPVQVESKSKRNAQGGVDIETTVKQIVNKHFASGDADQVMQGRFNVGRKLDRHG